NFPVGYGPTDVQIADLNGDGRSDLAVSDYNGNSVTVLLGDALGSFGSRSDLWSGYSTRVRLADLDGDGDLDIVDVGDGERIRLNNGDATFGAWSDVATSAGPVTIAAGDLGGDRRFDNVTAGSMGNTLDVHGGNGDGTFRAPLTYPTLPSPLSVAVGDL